MPQGTIALTEGSGQKRLSTWNRTKSGTSVESQYVLQDEPANPTYSASATGVSLNVVSGGHILAVHGVASTYLRIKRVIVQQVASAAASVSSFIRLVRLTSQGVGGASVTPAAYSTASAASGSVCYTTPATPGVESVFLWSDGIALTSVAPASSLNRWEWREMDDCEPMIIPPGSTNGIAVKQGGLSTATVCVSVEWIETTWV